MRVIHVHIFRNTDCIPAVQSALLTKLARQLKGTNHDRNMEPPLITSFRRMHISGLLSQFLFYDLMNHGSVRRTCTVLKGVLMSEVHMLVLWQ